MKYAGLEADWDSWHDVFMPKRNSTEEDFAMNARRVVEQAIGEPLIQTGSKAVNPRISKVMAQMGRKGGLKGGKRRLETMTPERRSEIALKAAKARWDKRAKLSS